jgi:hypothetical protein
VPAPDTITRARSVLATAGPGAAWHALELALAGARAAGEEAIRDNRGLTVREQLAVALQDAAEAIEGLGVALAEDGGKPQSDILASPRPAEGRR